MQSKKQQFKIICDAWVYLDLASEILESIDTEGCDDELIDPVEGVFDAFINLTILKRKLAKEVVEADRKEQSCTAAESKSEC